MLNTPVASDLLEALLKEQFPNASQEEIDEAIGKGKLLKTDQQRGSCYTAAAQGRDIAIAAANALEWPLNLAGVAAAWAAYAAACAICDRTIPAAKG